MEGGGGGGSGRWERESWNEVMEWGREGGGVERE